MIRAILPALALAAGTAAAGVPEAIEDHILPGYERLAATTDALAQAAARDCTAAALRDPYAEAFDAWARIGHLRLGPVEEQGRVLAIEFWPDTRGMTDRTLASLIADEDDAVATPAAFADVSVAGRGLMALDRLLFDADYAGYDAQSYTCAYAEAVAADLARMASEVLAEWKTGYADTLREAGAPGNAIFLSEREARQALFTALTSGFEFDIEQRLGRPLGTFERPRPELAEARRSGRPLANLVASLEGLREFAAALSDAPAAATTDAIDRAIEVAAALDDPTLAGVADPQGRFEVEIVQQRVDAARLIAINEIGTALGVTAGFNAGDGD